MSVPIQPLGDYVVAQQEEAALKTNSGLYIPESAKEKPTTAKVVAVGKDIKHLKVGDRIVYKTYSSTELKVENVQYLVIKEEDVLATVN